MPRHTPDPSTGIFLSYTSKKTGTVNYHIPFCTALITIAALAIILIAVGLFLA